MFIGSRLSNLDASIRRTPIAITVRSDGVPNLPESRNTSDSEWIVVDDSAHSDPIDYGLARMPGRTSNDKSAPARLHDYTVLFNNCSPLFRLLEFYRIGIDPRIPA